MTDVEYEDRAEKNKTIAEYGEAVAWASDGDLGVLLRLVVLEVADRKGQRYLNEYLRWCVAESRQVQRGGAAWPGG